MEIFVNRFACCIVGFVYTKLYNFSTNKNSTSTKNSIAEDDEADNILVVTTPPSRETMEENA